VEERKADWAQIAANPRFQELHGRKVKFLFGWWIFSIIIYVIFLVCSILFAQSFFAWRVIGDINIGYLLILVLFVYCWWLAGYYASWANKVSDRITTELVEELKEGGMQK